MDRDQIILAIEQRGCSSGVFADAQLSAREIRLNGEKESAALSSSGFIALVMALPAFAGAISISSVMAPITVVTLGLSMAWAIGEHMTKTVPAVERATEMDLLLSDATPEDWAVLAELCGSPQDLMDCLRAGVVAGNQRSPGKGTRYHAALVHAHGLGKVLPPEFPAPIKTGFGKPNSLPSWRDTPKDGPESLPTNAEIALVIKLCGDRAGVKAVATKILALREAKQVQAALNLAITHAGISDRDYVKAGIELRRLKAIKKWAAEGDTITIEPAKPIVVPVLEAAPVVAPEVVQAPIDLALPVVDPVKIEEEEIEEAEEDEEEQEDDEPIVQAARPVFQQRANTRIPIAVSIWDTTDLDTIEPADVGNVNQFPIILVVAGQGNGKTVTLAWLFEQLSGRKAMFTPKIDDHRNPAIKNVFDLMFGFNADRNRGAWFGNQSSFHNSDSQDLDWYLTAKRKHGSALDFLHAACQTAENRTATGKKKDRDSWRVFYDEAAQTYTAGFTNTIGDDGISLGQKGEKDCQWFITGKLKPAIFNFRGAGVQLFIGCQSETVENIGLKGCAEARDEAWHLYPGPKAIEVARKHKQSKLVAFLQRAIGDGYAISILEKEGQQFKIIRMPKLAELERFDPIDEDESEEIPTVETIEDGTLDESWNDEDEEMIEPAIASSVEAETLDQMAVRIMAMTGLSTTTRLQMIEDAQRG